MFVYRKIKKSLKKRFFQRDNSTRFFAFGFLFTDLLPKGPSFRGLNNFYLFTSLQSYSYFSVIPAIVFKGDLDLVRINVKNKRCLLHPHYRLHW